jgi:hypothetical protein
VGMETHSVEASRGHRPTIAHFPKGTVHRLPLENPYSEKVPEPGCRASPEDLLVATRRAVLPNG